jgi:hypothetical protein
MLREDLKAHEIRKIIVAKGCVTVIIPMALLREVASVSLKRPNQFCNLKTRGYAASLTIHR